MKFTVKWEKKIIAEWRHKYLDFYYLKKLLSKIEKQRYETYENDDSFKPLTVDEITFFEQLHDELVKVDSFYHSKEQDILKNERKILSILCHVEEHNNDNNNGFKMMKIIGLKLNFSSSEVNTRHRIKAALKECYHSLELLKSFRELNVTAYSKIVKIFCKASGRPLDSWQYLAEVDGVINLEGLSFFKSAVPEHLFREIENAYSMLFLDGNIEEAVKVLRAQDINSEEYYGSAELSGLVLGVCIALLLLIARILNYNADNKIIIEIAKIYYAIGLFFLIAWLFVIHAKVWETYKINFRFILGIDYHQSLHNCQYSVFVGLLSVTYLVGVFTSLYLISENTPYTDPIYHPCALLGLFLIILAWPLRLDSYQNSLFWLSRVLCRIVTTPYFPCQLKDFFIADVCVSLSFSFKTLGVLLFYVLNGGPVSGGSATPMSWYVVIFQLLPFYWRAVQCLRRYYDMGNRSVFPHMVNFCKYGLSLVLVVMDNLIPAAGDSDARSGLIFVHVLGSLFSLTWDIFMDFGLLWQPCLPGHERLREPILFQPNVYWAVLILNIIARFLWVLSYVGPSYKFQYLSQVLALVELLRRFQWIFIRIEYEHVNNCNALRVVTDIKLQSMKVTKAPVTRERAPSTIEMAMSHIHRARSRRASELFYADMAESPGGPGNGRGHSESLHDLVAEAVTDSVRATSDIGKDPPPARSRQGDSKPPVVKNISLSRLSAASLRRIADPLNALVSTSSSRVMRFLSPSETHVSEGVENAVFDSEKRGSL